jgi:hypothetical protein
MVWIPQRYKLFCAAPHFKSLQILYKKLYYGKITLSENNQSIVTSKYQMYAHRGTAFERVKKN